MHAQCNQGYMCNFKHPESSAPPGWRFDELDTSGDVRGIPTFGRSIYAHWRDGQCRFEFPVNTRTTRERGSLNILLISDHLLPAINANNFRRVICTAGNSSTFPPNNSTAQTLTHELPPTQAKAQTQLPLDEWAKVVQGVLPYLSSDAKASAGTRTMASNNRDCGHRRAARALPELPYRKVPEINPTGAHTPSASLSSVHAAAAKSSAPPPSTNQTQSETNVFPFSQYQQVVTSSDNIPDSSADTNRPKEEGGNRNSWADMSEDVHGTAAGAPSSIKRPLSPSAFPILDKIWRSSVNGSNGSLRLKSLLQRLWNGCNMPSLLSSQQPFCKSHGMTLTP